jgi:hypothetical protein
LRSPRIRAIIVEAVTVRKDRIFPFWEGYREIRARNCYALKILLVTY